MDDNDLGWIEYARWELMDYDVNSQDGLARWNAFSKTIKFDQFKDNEIFDNDPYKYAPLFGFHRQYLPGLLD